MKTAHRYILEPYKGMNSRHRCPGCHKDKTFSLYIDTQTGEHIHPTVGRCNREDKCGYLFTPKQYFENNKGLVNIPIVQTNYTPQPAKQLFTMSIENHVNPSLCNYSKNSFALGLKNKLGEQAAVDLLIRYESVGTNLTYPGAVTFWQISHTGTVYTGKVMKYNPETLKREKDFTTWEHVGKFNEATHERRSCLFGLHLTTLYPNKPIAITEAEKTAIICSHFMPQFNWMAAGNINGLTSEKLMPLRGKNIVLFPDLGKAHSVWTAKANEFKSIANISVSQYLKSIATEQDEHNGNDLADLLLRN